MDKTKKKSKKISFLLFFSFTKFKKYVADSSTGYQIIGYVTKDHLDEVKQCVKEIEGLRIEDYPSQVSAKRLNDAKLA